MPDSAILKLETLAQTRLPDGGEAWHARISYRLQAPKIFPKWDHFPVTSRQGGLETRNWINTINEQEKISGFKYPIQ